MNPFAKRKVTAEERKAILAEARKTWDSIGEHQVIFGNRTDEDYLSAIDAGLEVTGGEFVEPAPQTAFEKQEFESRIVWEDHLSRLRIPIPGKELTGIAAIDKAWKETQDAEMQKFLAPARNAETSLQKMVEDVVARVLRKASGESSLPSSGLRIRPTPERQGLVPMLEKAREFSENSDAFQFLSAYVSGDEAGMRKLVRELEAA